MYNGNGMKFVQCDSALKPELPKSTHFSDFPINEYGLTAERCRNSKNTVCIARERLKVRHKKDKEDGTSEVFEEV
jgi:hypothetical protein